MTKKGIREEILSFIAHADKEEKHKYSITFNDMGFPFTMGYIAWEQHRKDNNIPDHRILKITKGKEVLFASSKINKYKEYLDEEEYEFGEPI